MNVLVYDGPGTSALSLRHTLHSLRQLLPAYSVQKIGLEGLLHEPWTGKAAALFIPGGRDLPYCRDLDGRGTQRIREYVMSGGRYIGLCAGGYFGSRHVEFELGTALEVKGNRELSFFPGIAKGCVYRGFSYDNELGARAATLTYQGADGQVDQSTMYYNGGCQFVLDGDKEDGKVSWIPTDQSCRNCPISPY
jgi:biotin--protein ligase